MATTSYADIQNNRYKNSSSNFVTLDQRLQETLENLPIAAQRNWNASLKKSLAAFRKKYPNLKTLNRADGFLDRENFPMCQAVDKPLIKVLIDTTMQRQLDLKWVLKIIENFRPYQAQPIQCYTADEDGYYGGWDGQHTAMALWLIAVYGLEMDPETVVVPVNMYDLRDRGQLRSTFISNNTTTGKNRGKNPLDLIDIVQQMIYGVECDGVTEPEWVEMHQKWEILRDAGMFLTAEKFNNTQETGAISRVNEIMDASVGVVRLFAEYGKYVIENQATDRITRPIDSKEIPIIIEFLNLCEADPFVWDHMDSFDVKEIAQHCIDMFDANFQANGPFWDQTHRAIVNAWRNYNLQNNIPRAHWGDEPRNNKNVPTGMNFFWHQLDTTWKSTTGLQMPKRPNYSYQISTEDLF